MIKMIASINILLQSIREEKTKAVKHQDYPEAEILRTWEKDIIHMQSAMQSHHADRTSSKCGYCQKPYEPITREDGWEACKHCEGM